MSFERSYVFRLYFPLLTNLDDLRTVYKIFNPETGSRYLGESSSK